MPNQTYLREESLRQEIAKRAVAFVEAVANTNKLHPEWSELDNSLDYSEVPKWHRLRASVRKLQRATHANEV